MKTTGKTILALLALGASASLLIAQDNAGQQPPDGNGHPQGGQGMRGQRPPPPIIAALDANHDGTIDESEIANASAALRQLDKNGDGKLTPDELRPPRPEGQGGPRGQNGPGGQVGSSGQGGQGGQRGEGDEGRPPRGPQSAD